MEDLSNISEIIGNLLKIDDEIKIFSEKQKILRKILGDYYESNNEMLFSCPFCDHHKKKMSVNLDKNVWKCWVCDSSGRSIEFLVKKFGR